MNQVAYKKFVRGEDVSVKAFGTRASRPVGSDEKEFKSLGGGGSGNNEKKGRDKRDKGRGRVGGSKTSIKAEGEVQASAGTGSSLAVVGDEDAKVSRKRRGEKIRWKGPAGQSVECEYFSILPRSPLVVGAPWNMLYE